MIDKEMAPDREIEKFADTLRALSINRNMFSFNYEGLVIKMGEYYKDADAKLKRLMSICPQWVILVEVDGKSIIKLQKRNEKEAFKQIEKVLSKFQ